MQQVENWHKDFKEMLRTMNSGFEIVQSQLIAQKDLNKNSLESTEGMLKRLDVVHPIFATQCRADVEQTTNKISDLKTGVEDSKQMRPTLSLHTKSCDDIKTIKHNAKQLRKEGLLKVSENIDSYSEEFLQANIQDLRKMQRKLEERLQNVVSADAESYNESKHCTDELKQHLSYYDKSVEEVRSSLYPKLDKCESNVMNFADKHMIKIRHGGDTPARSQRNIPSSLKQPSPKDRILSKFRQHKECVEFQGRNGNGHDICTQLRTTIDESLGQDGSPSSSND